MNAESARPGRLRTDVAVVGAGPVGLAAAVLLRDVTGLHVTVLDARERPEHSRVDTPQVFALSRASERILARAGAWQALSAHACAYRRMRVWDARLHDGPEAGLAFDADDLGEPDLGHIVDSARIEQSLRDSLQGRDRVRLLAAARVQGMRLERDRACLALADGRELAASLVLGADGAASPTRALAGIDVVTRDYGQRGIVCLVEIAGGHRHTAWQRFLPEGPVALLPLTDGRCCAVWSVDEAQATGLLSLDDGDFRARLTGATGGVPGEVSACGPRFAFPLRLLHAQAYTARRFALLGDAAHVIHPLAGQGLNLGLLDAAALVDCLGAGADPGERRGLRRYERWRRGQNAAMLGGVDALQRLFAARGRPLTRLRGTGLAAVNALGPLRRACARRALGLSGELPSSAVAQD